MEEWKVYKLGDICAFNTERISLNLLNEGNYISTENMLPNIGGITISSNLPASGNAINYKEGDILISNIRPYFKKIWYANKEGGCSADVLCIRANKGIDKQYLYYLLAQQDFFDYVMAGAKGCKMPRGDKQHIMNWEVNVPNIETQQKIANILSSLDDKIEVNRRINEQLEELAQALFKSWFVDFEPFKDGEFVESELGIIPEGWKVGNLGDIANVVMGSSPAGSSYNTEGNGSIFYQGRTDFCFRFPNVRMFTTEPKRFAEQNSVLLSVRAPVGDVNIAFEKCCIGRGLASIKSNCNADSFTYYLLKSLRPVLDNYNNEGTVFGCINKDALNNLSILVPNIEVIKEYEKIVSSFDIEIRRRSEEITHLTNLRDTLLPKLMSGEIDVNEVKI